LKLREGELLSLWMIVHIQAIDPFNMLHEELPSAVTT